MLMDLSRSSPPPVRILCPKACQVVKYLTWQGRVQRVIRWHFYVTRDN